MHFNKIGSTHYQLVNWYIFPMGKDHHYRPFGRRSSVYRLARVKGIKMTSSLIMDNVHNVNGEKDRSIIASIKSDDPETILEYTRIHP